MRSLREIIIGPPLPTHSLAGERLGNVAALAALSPDALASIAYANQEIFLGLVVAGAAGLASSIYIALAITGLLTILSLSYSQTIVAYPAGGGSYTVARQNLGVNLGLTAAAGLMIAYILNVAVSATAGVAAVASAFPILWPYRVPLALTLLGVITLANLRGLRESGILMSVPVYLFLATFLAMIAVGSVRAGIEGPASYTAGAPSPLQPLTLLLVLRTFSSGATALTGIESISNGVPIFKPPESKHANQTLAVMTLLMAVLFLGTIGLTQRFAVVPAPGETILSALARRAVGVGPQYLVVQAATLLVLMVAANTSFVGFPRVASTIARDGYLPSQLSYLGDRLVFTNGILLLSGLAAALIVLFNGDTHALIPLFASGSFLAFTLSQAGMVAHWLRERGRTWRVKAIVNGLGVIATSVALLVIAVSKFLQGAWIVLILIPLFVWTFHQVKRHYERVAEQLSLRHVAPEEWTGLAANRRLKIVLPVSTVHRGTLKALRFARMLSRDVRAIVIDVDPELTADVRAKWDTWGRDVSLEVLDSPYRSIIGPLLAYLDALDAQEPERGLAVVVLPEFVPAHWWHTLLHNHTAQLIRTTLIYRRGLLGTDRVLIDVPYHLHR